MTLEQATQWASDAAAAGDHVALDQALTARAGAIAALTKSPPSAELEACLVLAIDIGKALERDLAALKLRIDFDRARLAQLQAGIVAGLVSFRDPNINFRG